MRFSVFPQFFSLVWCYISWIHSCIYHTDDQFAQHSALQQKCNHYYDHIRWFCKFTSSYGKTIQSHTRMYKTKRSEALSWYSCSEACRRSNTHTQQKVFTQDLKFCSWAHLGHHSQNILRTIFPFFPLQPHVLNELAFSKQSRSLFLFSSGFTSFAQYVRELEPIPKVILTDFFCILLKGKFFFYWDHSTLA